ncbi:hypothetical protein HCN44_000470 [Aphidius gifuensis]|uniref:Uncharacterized protein n=1 Tax=Aphidius gifuensis TaxID=684658 RepID=A0A835CRX1_APHGI|nr:hypothetical protein HCN44_000470 [Aphidius gifuensis]
MALPETSECPNGDNREGADGQENLEEYTVQFLLKKFCGINSQTNDNDNKLIIHNKIINDVRIIAEWAKESSIFFEFAINHPNSWLINWISSKDKFNHLDIVFNILRSDWKAFRATKDSEEFKQLNTLFDEYKKERPQNIRLGPTHNTSNLSSLVESQCVTFFTNFKNNLLTHLYKRLRKLLKNQKTQFFNEKGKEISIYKVLKNLFTKDILPDVEIFKRDEFKNLKFSKF